MASGREAVELNQAMEVLLKSLRSDPEGEYVLVLDEEGGGYVIYKKPLPMMVASELASSYTRLRVQLTKKEMTALLLEAGDMAWGLG